MIESFTQKRYRCSYCRKSWANQTLARKHAARCHLDPATATCATCSHFDRGDGRDPDMCTVSAHNIGAELPQERPMHCASWQSARGVVLS